MVKMDKFIFPADLIIMDNEADREVSIMLGRPFLVIGRALIDVQEGESTIKVVDQHVKFNVFNALKYPEELESFQFVEEVDFDRWESFDIGWDCLVTTNNEEMQMKVFMR